jgi:ferredoxin-NADP reductase
MATPRFATVSAVEPFGADTRLLTLKLPEPLGFFGGQYIIVDTGLYAASGKAVKRAYSLLSADTDQQRIILASKRLPGGPGSSYMHGLVPGDTVKFSGPWGKMRPAEGRVGPTLVLATDTGVTAALGLVCGLAFAPLLPHTRFLWLRTDRTYFLPESFVRARLPDGLRAIEIGVLPPVGHPERVAYVRALVGSELPRLRQAFIAGDGTVNYALLDDLHAAGVPATRDNLESFFHMPKKTTDPTGAV